MKKILVILIALGLIGGGGWLFLRSRTQGSSQDAVLKVTSTPVATIFLDNQNIGKTPYEQKHPAGEYTLKLVPETTSGEVVSWEGKIKLSPSLLTYVNRELGDSELTTAGETLTLEKISSKLSELAVLSTPDGATVTLKGEQKDVTPLILQDLEPGSYDLAVTSAGFGSRSIKIRQTAGYKLTAFFQLPLTGSVIASPTPTPSSSPGTSPKATPKSTPKASPKDASASASPKVKATPPPKPYVEILDTPTGFLRVRNSPSTTGEEVAQVSPGTYHKLLDEQSGWYKIEYETNKEGWISGQYAEKFE